MASLRILIVADDPLARAGLAMLLSEQPDFQVVGQVAGATVREGVLETLPADVLLWDLGWDSAAALEQLAESLESTPAVTVVLSDESQAGEAWAAGARGFLARDVNGPGLRAALIAVSQGLVVFHPTAAASLLPSGDHLPGTVPSALTPRELQVLQLLAEGLPNKGIAGRLEISDHTVKFHVNAIMGKLGAQSRTDAVMRATRAGLIIV
jgi:DNA-binding NarL/FixJ family response regulator